MQRPVGLVAVGFAAHVLAQVHVSTEALAMPVLAVAAILAVAFGRIDLARAPSRVELALLAFVAAWLVTSMLGLDARRSLLLSIPLLSTVVAVVALGRERSAAGTWDLVGPVLLVAATAHALLVLVAAMRGADSPAALIELCGSSWLVVPNDLAWAACLWPAWLKASRTTTGRLLVVSVLAVQASAFLLLHSRLGLLLGGLALTLQAGAAFVGTRFQYVSAKAAEFPLIIAGFAVALALLVGKGADSIVARLELWRAAWAVFLDAPVLGIGPHNFVLAYREHLPGPIIDPRLTPWPHSLPLELLAEGGLVLGTCAAVLLACVLRSDRSRGAMRVAIAVPVLMLCLVEASALRAWFWVLVAAWLGMANHSRDCQTGDTNACGSNATAPR